MGNVLSGIAAIANVVLAVLLFWQIQLQKEQMQIVQRTELQLILRDSAKERPLKQAALHALVALERSDNRRPDLSWVQLDGLDLASASERVNLEGANLQNAVFRDASMKACILSNADLRGADLRGTDLSSADMNDVSCTGILYSASTRFPSGFDTTKCTAPK